MKSIIIQTIIEVESKDLPEVLLKKLKVYVDDKVEEQRTLVLSEMNRQLKLAKERDVDVLSTPDAFTASVDNFAKYPKTD